MQIQLLTMADAVDDLQAELRGVSAHERFSLVLLQHIQSLEARLETERRTSLTRVLHMLGGVQHASLELALFLLGVPWEERQRHKDQWHGIRARSHDNALDLVAHVLGPLGLATEPSDRAAQIFRAMGVDLAAELRAFQCDTGRAYLGGGLSRAFDAMTMAELQAFWEWRCAWTAWT